MASFWGIQLYPNYDPVSGLRLDEDKTITFTESVHITRATVGKLFSGFVSDERAMQIMVVKNGVEYPLCTLALTGTAYQIDLDLYAEKGETVVFRAHSINGGFPVHLVGTIHPLPSVFGGTQSTSPLKRLIQHHQS